MENFEPIDVTFVLNNPEIMRQIEQMKSQISNGSMSAQQAADSIMQGLKVEEKERQNLIDLIRVQTEAQKNAVQQAKESMGGIADASKREAAELMETIRYWNSIGIDNVSETAKRSREQGAGSKGQDVEDGLHGVDAEYTATINAAKSAYSDLDKATQEYLTELLELDIQLQKTEAAQKALDEAKRKGTIGEKEHTQATAALTAQQKQISESIDLVNQRQREHEAVSNRDVTSINGMRAALSQLQQTYNELSESERNSPLGRGMSNDIGKLQQQFAGANAQGQSARPTFNGLQNSINQLTREMPAFANSVQTGFMAISNNIPIFVDEINRLKAANTELNASGQKAPSIWKQLAGSFFSWNTLISVGITLLTVYGKEIVGWIASLFKGKEAVDEAKLRVEALNKALSSTEFKKAVGDVTEFTNYVNLAKQGLLDKQKVVELYNDSLGKAIGRVQSLSALEDNLITKAPKFVEMMMYKAAAQKATESMIEDITKIGETKNQSDDESLTLLDKGRRFLTKYGIGMSQYNVVDLDKQEKASNNFEKERAEERRQDAIKEAEQKRQAKQKLAEKLNEEAAKIAKDNKLDFFTGSGKSNQGSSSDKLQNAYDSILDKRKGLLEHLQQLDDEYKRKSFTKDNEEVQALKDKFEKFRRLIDEYNNKATEYNKTHSKKIDLIDAEVLTPLENNATEDLTYRQATTKLMEGVNKQKEIYTEFEAFKRETDKETAEERFKNDKVSFDNYGDYLRSEVGKIDNAGDLANGPVQERLKALNKLLEEYTIQQKQKQDKEFSEAYEAALTFQQKIDRINDAADKKINSLKTSGKGITPEQEAEINRQRNVAIDAAKDEAFKKTAIYRQLNKQVVQYTKEQLKIHIQSLEEFLREAGDKLPEELKTRLTAQLNDAKDKLSSSSASNYEKDLHKLKQSHLDALHIQQMGTAEYEEQLEKLKEINAELKKTTADKFSKISDKLSKLSGAFNELGSAVSYFDEGLGDTLQTMGELCKVGADAAASVASFASGDFVGGIASAISAISGVINIFSKSKESARKAKEEIDKFYDSVAKGEYEYIRLLRERERTQSSISDLNNKELATRKNLLDIQTKQAQVDYNNLLKKLQFEGKEITGEHTEKYGGFLGIGKKTKVVQDLAELKEADYDKLEKLYTEGKLTDETKAWFEQLKAAKYEMDAIGTSAEDVFKEIAQRSTGTTAAAITDTFLEGFKNGKRVVEDFADDTEELIRGALLSAMKYQFLEEPIKKLYQQFAADAENGLSTSEVESFTKSINETITNASAFAAQLEASTGIQLSNAKAELSQNSLAGAVKGITAEQANLLGGQLGGLRIAQLETNTLLAPMSESMQEQRELFRQNLLYLAKIEYNTGRTASNTDKLETIDKSLKNISVKMDDNYNALKAAGLI